MGEERAEGAAPARQARGSQVHGVAVQVARVEGRVYSHRARDCHLLLTIDSGWGTE